MTWGYQMVDKTNRGEGLWFQGMIMTTMIFFKGNVAIL
jgi:hypothetical protein